MTCSFNYQALSSSIGVPFSKKNDVGTLKELCHGFLPNSDIRKVNDGNQGE